jgi:hypothetical protein
MKASGNRPARPPVTYAAPKYGPTSEYGDCEAADCSLPARTTCPQCSGQHCRRHAAHPTHTEQAG